MIPYLKKSKIIMKKILILLIVFTSCYSNKKNIEEEFDVSDINRNDELYIVDIDTIKELEEINLSTFFENINTVILEDSELIGRVNKMYILKDSIFILDRVVAKSLLVYNKKGEFLKKIGAIGQGPGEYILPFDFSININEGLIYLLDSYSQRINIYDVNTCEYIESIKLNDDKRRIFQIELYNNQLYSDAHFLIPSTNNYLLQELDDRSGITKDKWLNIYNYNHGWSEIFFPGHSPFYKNNDGEVKYVELFMDTVLSIDNEIKPYLVLKSKNWVSSDYIQSLSGLEADQKYNSLLQTDYIYNLHNYMECKDIIYFEYEYGPRTKYVFYNIKSGRSFITNKLNNDILFKGNYREVPKINFAFSDENGFWGYIHPLQMEKFLNQLTVVNNVHNIDKIDRLMSLKPDSNPIIFYYEYKE